MLCGFGNNGNRNYFAFSHTRDMHMHVSVCRPAQLALHIGSLRLNGPFGGAGQAAHWRLVYPDMAAPPAYPGVDRRCQYLPGTFRAKLCTVRVDGEVTKICSVPGAGGLSSEWYSLDDEISRGGQGVVFRGKASGELHIVSS